MKKDLRNYVRGKPCYARLDGCSYDPSQTVLAHLRIGGVAGMGQKPPDVCAMPMCAACHDLADGRRSVVGATSVEVKAALLRGYVQWIADLWADEVVRVIL